MTDLFLPASRRAIVTVFAVIVLTAASLSSASDHLDTRTVVADPRADIGDIYAWTSYDSRRLNLIMTMVGHSFSDQLQYAFHVDSGKAFGQTNATTSITCRIIATSTVDCRVGEADRVQGDAGSAAGLEGPNRRARVFAGMRDDPFFNNVKGSRDAYQVAAGALRSGATVDAAGCPRFDTGTSRSILAKWRQTDGGPGTNFLAGWTPASLVVSVDLEVVTKGGPMLAVWATTGTPEKQVDRMGRPLTGNAMLAPLAADEVSDTLKERYNRATPASSAQFITDIQKTLGLYDAFDGHCGNQILADPKSASPLRYRTLGAVLADDRLWVNSESTLCTHFFAVELTSLAGQSALAIDCGGRAPSYDAVDVYRSLLADGSVNGVDDGVDRDEREHSNNDFPFLAPP
jgi:hypothetical protein